MGKCFNCGMPGVCVCESKGVERLMNREDCSSPEGCLGDRCGQCEREREEVKQKKIKNLEKAIEQLLMKVNAIGIEKLIINREIVFNLRKAYAEYKK